MGLGSLLGFKNKQQDMYSKFPKNLPLGLRINGLVHLNTSLESYFMVNDGKTGVVIPCNDSGDFVVDKISTFNLFNLEIFRAYLHDSNPASFFQIHTDNENGKMSVNDIIFFNVTHSIKLKTIDEKKQWIDIIGWKDITHPNGYTYEREWGTEGNFDYIMQIEFFEKQFVSNVDPYIEIRNKSMLYSRYIDAEEENIEFLMVAFVGNDNKVVEISLGSVVNENDFQFI